MKLLLLALGVLVAGCTQPLAIRLIGEQRLAPGLQRFGSAAGGLSGLDFDRARGVWVAVSDDRAERGAPRFYTIELDYNSVRFAPPRFSAVTALQAPPGPGYGPAGSAHAEVPDLEALRVDPRNGSIWYASEGSRALGQQPFVRQAARDGRHIGELDLGARLRVDPQREQGIRNNQSIEGLAFSRDGRALWVALEAPLYQDGELATLARGGPVRLSRFGRSGRLEAQYAYQLEPLAAAPATGMAADNGVAEVLVIENDRLLVLERGGAQAADGSFRYVIRLFEADLRGASDIATLDALQGASYRPAHKRLVLELNTLPVIAGNVEAMAWGPRLAGGVCSLVLMSDDNFGADLGTQFFAFEVTSGCNPP